MAILKFRDNDGVIHEVLTIKGEDYVLTEDDKQEIAQLVIDTLPTAEDLTV